MSVWISNCGIETTHRMSIMEELASHGITYASYGGCKKTHAVKQTLASLSNDD